MFSSEISISSILSTTLNSIMDFYKKPCSSSHVLRIEPKNIEWMSKFPLATANLKEEGWYTSCERIGDYNVEVTKSFCQNFKDSVVKVGGFEFPVT